MRRLQGCRRIDRATCAIGWDPAPSRLRSSAVVDARSPPPLYVRSRGCSRSTACLDSRDRRSNARLSFRRRVDVNDGSLCAASSQRALRFFPYARQLDQSLRRATTLQHRSLGTTSATSTCRPVLRLHSSVWPIVSRVLLGNALQHISTPELLQQSSRHFFPCPPS